MHFSYYSIIGTDASGGNVTVIYTAIPPKYRVDSDGVEVKYTKKDMNPDDDWVTVVEEDNGESTTPMTSQTMPR